MKKTFDPVNLLCVIMLGLPAVGLLLIVLKLSGLFPFSWWLALAPILLTAVLFVGFCFVGALISKAADADIEAAWAEEERRQAKNGGKADG